MPGARMVMVVTRKLMAPPTEEIPRIWTPRIQRSVPWPGEKVLPVSGGYSVQPAWALPPATKKELNMKQRGQGDEPEAQGVDPRVSHVLGADHQRQQVVTEAGAHRDDEEEEHGGGVHREELVVLVLGQEVVVGPGKLSAHQQRQHAADEEERDVKIRYMMPIFLWSVVSNHSRSTG